VVIEENWVFTVQMATVPSVGNGLLPGDNKGT